MVNWKKFAAATTAILGYAQAAPAPDSKQTQDSDIVKGRYIIRLRDEVADFQTHIGWVNGAHRRNAEEANFKDAPKGVLREFNYPNVKLKGYSGEFDEATLEELRNNDAVRT